MQHRRAGGGGDALRGGHRRKDYVDLHEPRRAMRRIDDESSRTSTSEVTNARRCSNVNAHEAIVQHRRSVHPG